MPSNIKRLPYLTEEQNNKMKALEESRKNVPRYLFRAYSQTSGGGQKGLNSPEAIVPHAFLNGRGHKSIQEIPYDILQAMVSGHLSGTRETVTSPTLSEFSSWAASLPLVLEYGYGKSKMTKGAHICIVDRHKLPKTIGIYHVLSLCDAGLTNGTYPWEYLAHGIISGSALKAVPVRTLEDLGLYAEIPLFRTEYRKWWGGLVDAAWEQFPVLPMDRFSIRKLKSIAKEFGPDFTLVMLAGFATINRRRPKFDDSFREEDLKVFVSTVLDLKIPEEFGTKNSVVMEDVYVNGYPTIRQMVDLLKEVVNFCYGVGARQRIEKLKIEMLVMDMDELSLPKVNTEEEQGQLDIKKPSPAQ